MDNEMAYSIQDLVKFSYEQKPVDFEQAFNSLLSNKIADAVDVKKLEVAQNMFNTEKDINTEQDSDTEEELDGEAA